MIQPYQKCAYFSMEIMLETDIPSYAGGLGILAGDILRSCADKSIPVVGVSLVYSGNYFSQTILPDGSQTFNETDWQRMDQLTKLPEHVEIQIGHDTAVVGCWRYDIVGLSGHTVPVFLLDTNIPENPPWIRDITKNLYQANPDIRISQEIILGIGGVKMLQTLGYNNIGTYHLNEGHCSFVTLALLEKYNYNDSYVKDRCVFFTHTPVPEGHDRFSYEHAYYWAGKYLPWHIKKLATEDSFSLTDLGINLSKKAFAVSAKHRLVSQHLFPNYNFEYVTNGIHHRSWTWYVLQDLYDTYIPGWLNEPNLLSQAPQLLSNDSLWTAHQQSKEELVRYVNKHLSDYLGRSGSELFDVNTLTISLARRPVAYKRPLLIYSDLERLVRIGIGKIQIIQCGKSHPSDDVSQEFVRDIIRISQKLKAVVRIAYLENYSPKIARLLVAGSDVWLNTPRRPLEACGTSGMKAAINGGLNFSVLDGWWIEAYRANPQSGFTIGPDSDGVTPDNDDSADSHDLYDKLEHEIIPLYYNNKPEWISKMKQAISLGAHFNTHRVVDELINSVWN